LLQEIDDYFLVQAIVTNLVPHPPFRHRGAHSAFRGRLRVSEHCRVNPMEGD
jgi:hypothetical protein